MNRRVRIAVVVALQAALVAGGVAPQLSARASGDEIALRVAPVDPIEPFRGAYVALSYPDLPVAAGATSPSDAEGIGYVSLRRDGEVWVGTGWSTEPPEGLSLRCRALGSQVHCGIESWFLPQDRARELEQGVSEGTAVAVVRVDRWGNAALVEVTTR